MRQNSPLCVYSNRQRQRLTRTIGLFCPELFIQAHIVVSDGKQADSFVSLQENALSYDGG